MAKEYYIRFSEKEYMNIPPQFRSRATFVDNEFEKYSDDPLFISLYKEHRSIKKKLETRKHQLRHGGNTRKD